MTPRPGARDGVTQRMRRPSSAPWFRRWWSERTDDEGSRLQVDSVLGLVGQVRPTVLHLRDLRVRILWRLPLLVRRLPILPRPVEPSQVRPRRRLHPGRFRQPPYERLVGFSRVPPLDAPHRRVRFQRRRINADRLSPDQPRSRHPLQNPREHRYVRLHIDQSTRPGQRRLVWRRLGHIQVQEGPPAQRVRHPLRNPAFRRQALEVADEQASGNTAPAADSAAPSASRRTPRTAPRRRRRTRLLQDPVQTLEEGMPRVRRQIRRRHPQRRPLSRCRSLAHYHAVQCTKLNRAGAKPVPRLSPQAAGHADDQRAGGRHQQQTACHRPARLRLPLSRSAHLHAVLCCGGIALAPALPIRV